MAAEYVDASATKRFVVDMMIRDISLEDAILDLIDNCIDGYSRLFKIDFSSALAEEVPKENKRQVDVNFDDSTFSISDNCGGIEYKDAKEFVFKFGRDESHEHSALSVYGVGLKRAVFKIGRNIQVISKTLNSGFKVNIDVNKWLNDKSKDWQFEIVKADPAKTIDETGTTIRVRNLREEISAKLSDVAVQNKIFKSVSEAYPLFLDKHLDIRINKKLVTGRQIVLLQSQDLSIAAETWLDDDVKIELFCGLRPKDDPRTNVWKSEYSGWNVVCNGRVVVHSNKDDVTGWGEKGALPEFQPKHRAFTGIIFFSSKSSPEKLPWNTTKRGLNQESLVYLRTKQKMVFHGRDVVRMLDNVYKDNDSELPTKTYRDLIEGASNINASTMATESRDIQLKKVFRYERPVTPPEEKTVRVQYDKKNKDLDRVRERLKKKSMTAKAIGEYTYKYFIDRECK